MNRLALFPTRLFALYRHPEYFRQLVALAAPIALQQFVFAALNMVGFVMVGQKGDTAMAAVGAAGQIGFLLAVILFGLVSGSAMVAAQLWGKQDVVRIRKVLAISLWLSLSISAFFVVFSVAIPTKIIAFYTRDPAVIALGSTYLRISAGSFLFYAVTSAYAFILRSIGNVKVPVAIGVLALVLNVTLAYGLIFGRFGLPELGVIGGAWAILIARTLECLALVSFTYLSRSPIAASWRELWTFDRSFFIQATRPILPVVLTEVLWSLGITTYYAIYGRVSTEALAAVNILGNVDNVAFTIFAGIANATAVLVGNKIGAGEQDEAHRYGARSIGLSASLGLGVGLLILLLRPLILSLYRVSPQAAEAAYHLLTMLGLLFWLRMMNMITIVGILRGGGDVRFLLALDGCTIWIVGVPMAALGGLVLHLPVQWVYLMVMSEEAIKWVIGLYRFFRRRWIHDLTQAVGQVLDAEKTGV